MDVRGDHMDRGRRAQRHAALGDVSRLAIVDELARSDRAPVELGVLVGLPSNLLAHHLVVLESAGLITRHRSSGDGRRRYISLAGDALDGLRPGVLPGQDALFVCTRNSARSQLAAALWMRATGCRAASAGTHPANRIHPGARAAARRARLRLVAAGPRHLDDIADRPGLIVTVCDRAYEELGPEMVALHWSVSDPVLEGTDGAFDRALLDLQARIERVTSTAAAS